jgi:hypothetical protein
MKNYESPTIEQAGGQGNEIEPQVNVPLVITDIEAVAEFFYIWVWHKK